ncbi:MAG: LysM peptidoglycan-binding domain-containing protein [Chloroflexota bacterium]|nr:LysM peptidoglycan-binding domain-containing protein [Chloroflexota bacterium]
MRNITRRSMWQRLLVTTLSLFYLSGCVTISEPVEEPSPLEPLLPSITPTEELLFDTSTSIPLGSEEQVGFEEQALGQSEAVLERDLLTPTSSPAPPVAAIPRPSATPTRDPTVYEVVAGDTLNIIAIKHAISVEALMAANELTDADVLQVGQKLIIPTASQIVEVEAEQGTPIPTPQTESGHLIHYVRVGETISGIAEQYGVDRNDLLLANGFRPDVQLMAGNTVIIPQGEYEPIPTATALLPTAVPTVEVALVPSSTTTPAPSPTATVTATPAPNLYTVKQGDIARVIASNYGVTLEALRAANPGVNLDSLTIGDTLVIPPSNVAGQATSTATTVTLQPSATPTPIPTVVATHVVEDGDTVASIAAQYGVTEAAIKSHNTGLTETLTADEVLQIPLGTATPTPLPTGVPTWTATPTPKYLEPIPLLPTDGSTWMHWEGKAPLQLVWTSSGILQDDEFYVVRLRAVDEEDEVLWAATQWTKNPSWRLSTELIDAIDERVRLRWDVMVMRRTSTPNAEQPSGIALSNKSLTFEVTFVPSE